MLILSLLIADSYHAIRGFLQRLPLFFPHGYQNMQKELAYGQNDSLRHWFGCAWTCVPFVNISALWYDEGGKRGGPCNAG